MPKKITVCHILGFFIFIGIGFTEKTPASILETSRTTSTFDSFRMNQKHIPAPVSSTPQRKTTSPLGFLPADMDEPEKASKHTLSQHSPAHTPEPYRHLLNQDQRQPHPTHVLGEIWRHTAFLFGTVLRM